MKTGVVSAIAAIMAAMVVVSGCGTKDTSKRIVCDVNGQVTPTEFTFDSFHRTLTDEHGKVEAKQNEYLKSASLEIYFRLLGDGNLLAERVVLVKAKKDLAPAVLFGLAKAAPDPAPGLLLQSNVVTQPVLP